MPTPTPTPAKTDSTGGKTEYTGRSFEIARQMISRHPNLHPIALDNLQSKMRPDSMKMIAETIDGFEKDFPVLVKDLNMIRICDDPGAYAVAWPDGRGIGINPKLMGDGKQLEKSYASDVSQHWHPDGTTARTIIDHELGHLLTFRIAGREGVASKDWAKNVVNEACKTVRTQAGMKGLTKPKLVLEISRYAKTNDYETIAEAVADYRANGDKAKRLSIEIYKTLKSRAKGAGLT